MSSSTLLGRDAVSSLKAPGKEGRKHPMLQTSLREPLTDVPGAALAIWSRQRSARPAGEPLGKSDPQRTNGKLFEQTEQRLGRQQ